MAQIDYTRRVMESSRKPDFENLLAVLRREAPSRPTLFEFFLNPALDAVLAGGPAHEGPVAQLEHQVRGRAQAGYDFCTFGVSDTGFRFPRKQQAHEKSISLNAGVMITDRASFDAYPWPDPDTIDTETLDAAKGFLPDGMKLVCCGPCGVLENTIAIVGYENMCMLLVDDRQLLADTFNRVGECLRVYYERVVPHATIGAAIINDDWGFKTQTMLPPSEMREFVVPWHREYAALIHAAGKPAILHSCGQLREMMDDIIDDVRIDGKHSYEDAIQPVEDAYEQYHDRLAILGGIDVDFICRGTPDAIHARSRAMLDRTATRGAYALGTGNSVPEYVPQENYFAMIAAILD